MNLGKESRIRCLYFSRGCARKTDSCKSAIKQGQHLSRESEVFLTMSARFHMLEMVLSPKTPKNDKTLLRRSPIPAAIARTYRLAHLIRIFR